MTPKIAKGDVGHNINFPAVSNTALSLVSSHCQKRLLHNQISILSPMQPTFNAHHQYHINIKHYKKCIAGSQTSGFSCCSFHCPLFSLMPCKQQNYHWEYYYRMGSGVGQLWRLEIISTLEISLCNSLLEGMCVMRSYKPNQRPSSRNGRIIILQSKAAGSLCCFGERPGPALSFTASCGFQAGNTPRQQREALCAAAPRGILHQRSCSIWSNFSKSVLLWYFHCFYAYTHKIGMAFSFMLLQYFKAP